LVAALKAAGVMASIGVDCCEAYDRVRRRALLANAEASMRTAKSAGGGGLAVYAGAPVDEGAGDRQRAVDLRQNGQRSMPGALVTA
jgi:GGDEF domain-containing protein